MIIEKAKIITSADSIVYQVKVHTSSGNQTLWYKIDKLFGHLVSDTNDAALLSLLIPAMLDGDDIEIKGKISDLLYHNLTRKVIKLLHIYRPFLRPIKILPHELYANDSLNPVGVATGFSGGVDSFSAINDHYYSTVPDRLKITHLLFNNVGSHGHGGEGRNLFNKRYQKLLPTTQKMELPFVTIDSNLDAFYDKRKVDFLLTHTIRNVSAALTLQNGIGQYLYASSHPYTTLIATLNMNDISVLDPVTLPLLSTGYLNAIETGGEYTRVEKILAISKLPISHKSLNICLDSIYQMPELTQSGSEIEPEYTNCGKCKKCIRTLNTLRVLNRIELYSDAFDLDSYKKRELINFMHTMSSRHLLDREVISFAKSIHFPLPNRILIFLLSIAQKTRLKTIRRVSKCFQKTRF